MKRVLILFLSILALPLFGDERTAKRELIAEFFEVIDAKTLVQRSIDRLFNTMIRIRLGGDEELDDEQRAEYEAAKEEQQKEMRAFQERMYTRIDYVKFAETVYAPAIDENFNAEELRALIAFAKTEPGQKFINLIPELGIGVFAEGTKLLQEASQSAAEEMQKEEEAKKPWLRTMSDLRMLATATEARATDVEEYPNVSTLDELEPLLSPIYIKTVPRTDTWGTEYLYVSDGTNYRFVSAGADRRFDWSARQIAPNVQPRAMESLDADIVIQNGMFIQYPKQSEMEQEEP